MKKIFSLFVLSLPIATIAQQKPMVVAESNGAKMEKIGKDAYAIIHENATDQWPHGNTGVIVGSKEVMVIDACYLPSMAREDIKLIKSVTNKPVKYLAFTHWHFDHNNGTVAYTEAFPGITIISEKESQKYIELNQEWWHKMSTADGSPRKNAYLELKKIYDNGADSTGKKYTGTSLDSLGKIVTQRENEINELASLKVIVPNKTFSGSMTIDLGNHKVMLRDHAKANSPHDVSFYLPDEQVLFTGDMLVQSPLPYVLASWPVTWINALTTLEKIPCKVMVMGHGPVQYNKDYLKQFKNFLMVTVKRTEKMIREGKTLIQIQNELNLDDLRTGIWKQSSEATDEDWKYNHDTLIERIWRGLRGQG